MLQYSKPRQVALIRRTQLTMEAKPAMKRQRLDFSDTILIHAGDASKAFMIHKAVATKSSKLLHSLVSDDLESAREKGIVLRDISADAFEGYLHWLYTSEVLPQEDNTCFLELVELCIAGETLQDDAFCVAVLEGIVAMHKQTKTVPGWNAVQLAWERSLASSPLRRSIMDIWGEVPLSWSLDTLKKEHGYPREFVIDLFQEWAERCAKKGVLSTDSVGDPQGES